MYLLVRASPPPASFASLHLRPHSAKEDSPHGGPTNCLTAPSAQAVHAMESGIDPPVLMLIAELRMQYPPAVFHVCQETWRYCSPIYPDSPKPMRDDRMRPPAVFVEGLWQRLP